MGCANSKHQKEGLHKLAKICSDSEKLAEEMVFSLQECRETNRNLMGVLENMQRFIDTSRTGKN